MNGRRDDDHSVTLGEVFRLITALKEEHGRKLDSIEEQTLKTNGRTTTLEGQMARVQMDVRDLKPAQPPGVPVVTPEGESLRIHMSTKVWAGIVALVSSLAIFAPIVAEWLQKALGGKE
jgi:hypothetical protein